MTLYNAITQKTPIDKGWSEDQKFCVVIHGEKYLLRISPAHRFEQRRRNFIRMEHWAKLEIPMCRPIEFGVCEEGCYSLQTWVEGTNAEEYIPALSCNLQYAYGLDAGRMAKKLHSLTAPDDVPFWEERYGQKIDRKIKMYGECPLKYKKGELFLSFIEQNRHLIANRPQCYQHGDFHIGNMMIDRTDTLFLIDFEKEDYGDPWEEFNRIVWCAQAAPAFASGIVDGYFDNNVPLEFWKLLALYICTNTLSSLPWAIPFGDTEIQTMRTQAAQVLQWYNNMTSPIPTWYRHRNVLLQTPRLILRNVTQKDAEVMYDYRNNELCARFQRGQTKDLPGIKELLQRRSKDVITDRENFMVAVALKDSDQLIGEIVVMPNDGCFSIGYTFHYAHHRKGYAFESLSALIELLHGCYPKMEFISFTEPENIASGNLLRKLGYKDMGYIPQVESQMYGKWLWEQVHIAPLRDEDEDAMIELFVHPKVKKTYMLPDFPAREDARKLFLRMKELSCDPARFVVGIYAGDTLVGFMNETEKTETTIELGWVVHPDYQNRGFATQAAKAAIGMLFERGFTEVIAGAFEENPASLRVMEKCGMTRLDKTDHIEYRGKTHRCIYYSIKKV